MEIAGDNLIQGKRGTICELNEITAVQGVIVVDLRVGQKLFLRKRAWQI